MSTRNDNDDIVIRRAVADDMHEIGVLWEKLIDYHHDLDENLPKAAKEGGKLYTRSIVDRLDDTHTGIFVAEHKNHVVGFVIGVIADMIPEMFEQETGGFLADIFVEEAYRHCGIGRRLVGALTEWFRSRGVQHFEWYVAAQNEVGRKFWDSVGGQAVMIRMRLPL